MNQVYNNSAMSIYICIYLSLSLILTCIRIVLYMKHTYYNTTTIGIQLLQLSTKV